MYKSIFHWISDIGINARYIDHCGKDSEQLAALDSWNKNCDIPVWVLVCESVCVSVNSMRADTVGSAVWGVGLRSLNWWYHGFESRRGSSCSLVFVLCCVGSGLCYHELFTGAEECCRVCECLSVSELETSIIRRPRPGLLRHRRRGSAWGRPSSVVHLPSVPSLQWHFNTKLAMKANFFAVTFPQQYSYGRNQKSGRKSRTPTAASSVLSQVGLCVTVSVNVAVDRFSSKHFRLPLPEARCQCSMLFHSPIIGAL